MAAYLKAILFLAAASAFAQEPPDVQRRKVPSPPWPAGDERGIVPAGTKRLGPDFVDAKFGQEHPQRGGVSRVHRDQHPRHP